MNSRVFLLLIPLLLCCLSSCRCLVSCGLGERLDQTGRAEAQKPEFVEKKPFYQLDGCYYARVCFAYYSWKPGVLQIAYVNNDGGSPEPTGATIEGYLLMSARDVKHHLDRKVAEPPATARKFIPVREFDLLAARHLPNSPCHSGCRVRGTRATSILEPRGAIHPLTLTWRMKESYPGVPVRRSAGNYIRTPLAALLSYGIDAPVSLIGSALYVIVVAPGLIVYYCF